MSESDSYCEKCNTAYPYIGILGGGPCKCGGFCIPSSPNTRIIRDLRAENARLRDALERIVRWRNNADLAEPSDIARAALEGK